MESGELIESKNAVGLVKVNSYIWLAERSGFLFNEGFSLKLFAAIRMELTAYLARGMRGCII